MLSSNGESKGGREMSRKRFTPEHIIGKLREAEVALAQMETATNILVTAINARFKLK
jgi:hypothetical protein